MKVFKGELKSEYECKNTFGDEQKKSTNHIYSSGAGKENENGRKSLVVAVVLLLSHLLLL